MIPKKDNKNLQELYKNNILTKRIDESFLDSLAAAEPNQILDPNTANTRDAEFIKKIDALKSKNSNDKFDLFGVAKKTSLKAPLSRPADINKLGTGKNLQTINAKQLKNQLETTYIANLQSGTAALMIYGASGIGKSDIIRQMAKKFAATEQREFVYWANANDELRKNVFANPKHYYVCSVMNASQLAPEKLGGGIPNMFQDEPRVTERPFEEMAIWMTPGISGMLFLDELNHADKDKMNTLFSIVLEKRAGSRKLEANRMLIVGAGNLGGGHHVTDLPQALVNRVRSFWLVVDPEDWFEWAGKNDIDPTILAFVKSAPQHNFRVEHDPLNKVDKNVGFPCPRNFERLSEALKPIYEGYSSGHFEEEAENYNLQSRSGTKTPEDLLFDELYTTASGLVGEVWSGYWITFIKNYSKFGELDKLIKLDSKQLASYYQSNSNQSGKTEEREVLNVIGGISHYLHTQLDHAIDQLGIFNKKGELSEEFVGTPPSALKNSSEQEVVDYKKRMQELFNMTFNSPKSDNLKKVLQALSNTVKAVKNTSQLGNQQIPVEELVPMLTQRVPAGLSKDQRFILSSAVMFYGKTDPLVKELQIELSKYLKDVELK